MRALFIVYLPSSSHLGDFLPQGLQRESLMGCAAAYAMYGVEVDA